jgi:uncharacterized damage-inducible protein DinB
MEERMSAENPYDKFLDGRPVGTILADTANRIAEFLEVIGKDKESVEPSPGKWSASEIVCHLADCEIVFSFRLRQTLAEDGPTIQPFDQDKWAWAEQYSHIPAALALETFTVLRKWNLQMMKTVLPAAAGRKMTHPERGTMTFGTVVETMAGHDLNHLGQLRKIAGQG